MGLAIGMLVLWELGALPVPFDSNAGPIARAAIAVAIAIVGAIVGFALQLGIARLLPSRKDTAHTDADG